MYNDRIFYSSRRTRYSLVRLVEFFKDNYLFAVGDSTQMLMHLL